ncbi:D12 class N6 adenine-specific DNA methyltransferase [Flavobacterium psychrophilum]|uniref:DNA adenine methylase n=1 Tax=Flavobacterium psychrophilum TaxID=96345 RepID=UPI000B7C4322|nr:DNA adenine methylase [Flavobacterium psychrophilum]SNA83493.1 D12 class N6 adenine-specific DNA methyltransferase [Flavobacterium psychrophilum]
MSEGLKTIEKPKARLKTPISYYGGKQSMLKHILPIIPEHTIYVEPFFGGGAVFWAKEPAKVEVVNDLNGNVINFYEQLKTNFVELKTKVDATPYSREVYKSAMVVYETPYIFNPVTRAWAFWVGTIQGFSNKIGSWRSSTQRHKESLLNHNKKDSFTTDLSKRLDTTQIECMDAVQLILKLDSENTFFYIDPPYVGANQGHYGGYTQEHFDDLLKVLSQIKGKFLLSSYPNDILDKYRIKYKWFSSDKDMVLSASRDSNKRKIEALTSNYLI